MQSHRLVTLVVLAGVAFTGRAVADDGDGTALRSAIDVVTSTDAEMVVTATRTRRDVFDLPQSIVTVSQDEIANTGGLVAMRALYRKDAGIWYDERTSTTTDPIIRGFAGFNLLTLVDGNTLSTLWGEGGFGADDMYGKVDPDMIERIEVIRGPNSALYGSNALGAVINVISRSSPLDFTDEGYAWGGRTRLSTGTAAQTAAVRQELYGATPDFRYLFGFALRRFDHVRSAAEAGVMRPTDGKERNWDLSTEFRVGEDSTLRFTVQDVFRYGIKRFYRPTQDNSNEREAYAVTFNQRDLSGGPDELEFRLYKQKKVDKRWFYDTNTRGVATTDTWQGGARITREVGSGHVLTAGLQTEFTSGDSPDDEQFTIIYPSPKRRDAPLSDWNDVGLYVQDEWAANDLISLTGSVRYDRQTFKTDVDGAYVPAVGNPQDDSIRDSISSLTGGLGAVFHVTPQTNLTASWARGFRQNAPNFGVRQLGDGILIPNELLDPITSDNFEVGVKHRTDVVHLEGSLYHSKITNWQGDLRPTMFNGSSWLDFNRNGSRDANESYVTQVEGGDAWVQGVELNATLFPNKVWDSIPPNWSVRGSFALNKGRVDATDTSPAEEPLRHTQPMRGILAFRWDDVQTPKTERFFEFVVDMVDRYHAIPADRRASDLAWRRDAQDGTSPPLRSYVGTPGYTLFHFYAGMKLSENVHIRGAVENLTDKAYRAAHSRADAPGIDFRLVLDIDF